MTLFAWHGVFIISGGPTVLTYGPTVLSSMMLYDKALFCVLTFTDVGVSIDVRQGQDFSVHEYMHVSVVSAYI